MFLERIEMTGFKSFADKTVIEFDQGLTAVVGPNGSGKSNLSEAIRWVLGEQSAKSLRGDRMEDVIFNGTQARPSLNMAKVSLVLNNKDRYLNFAHDQVIITRSYHRNGDSHYMINNEHVRLKDIVDLFLDSGLGKNSFSIISQGQVEQIFLNKPEERRVIFEEAAGVQKYQYRKTEAQRKIERSEDNLSRLKDIIYELHQQVKPLEKQAENAKIFLGLQDTLQTKEISLYTYHIREHQQKWKQLEVEYTQLQEEIKTLTQVLEDDQIELNAHKEQQEEYLLRGDLLAEDLQRLTTQLETKKRQQELLMQELKYLTEDQKDYEIQVEQLKADNISLEGHKQSLKQLESDINERIQHFHQAREDLLEQIHHLSKDQATSAEEIRNELVDLYNQQAQAKNQLLKEQQDEENYTNRKEQLQRELVELKEASQLLKKAMQDGYEELQQLEEQHEETMNNLHLQENNLKTYLNEQKTMQTTIFSTERHVQQLTSKLREAQAQQANYAGYYQGVRAIMKVKSEYQGVIGPVADIISVEEPFRLAIDTALGSALQNIIVDNDQTARRGIAYLKKNRAGRVTFLPLTNIKNTYIDQAWLNTAKQQSDFVATADQLVQADAKYEDLLRSLLARTLVTHTLKGAQNLARSLNYRAKIVTLEGDLLLPGGSVTGGYVRQMQSLLSRQQDITDLSDELKKANSTLSEHEAKWENLHKEIKSQELSIQQLRDIERHTSSEIYQLRQDLINKDKELTQKDNKVLISESDVAALIHNLDELTISKLETKAEIASIQEKITKGTNLLAETNLSEEDQKQKLKALQEEKHQLETQLAVEEVRHQQLLQEQLSHEDKQLALSEQLKNRSHDYENNKVRHDELEREIETLKDEVHELEEVHTDLPQQIKQTRSQRQNLLLKIKELEENMAEKEQKSNALYKTFMQVENNIEKVKSKIDQQLTYLNEEYQLSYEMAESLAQEVENAALLTEEVKNLKRKISSLGPINVQAIEEFELLHTRYEDLKSQEQDLLEAIKQLNRTIKQLDQEVIQRFSAAFELIDIQFRKTFAVLFGGGSAYLELTDPQDILTTGIDIIAQPPGKKKQNLALLSGGERALTAIALLFSILQVKPVPFVVLDEVEAALDEANVYRYGEYIQRYTAETQFIVITHRKGTMEHADALYGVTMEDSGVSKLASVQLSHQEGE